MRPVLHPSRTHFDSAGGAQTQRFESFTRFVREHL
jgi:hypothetical protein